MNLRPKRGASFGTYNNYIIIIHPPGETSKVLAHDAEINNSKDLSFEKSEIKRENMFAAKHISSPDTTQSTGVEKAIKSSCSNYIWTCSYVSRARLLERIPAPFLTTSSPQNQPVSNEERHFGEKEDLSSQ